MANFVAIIDPDRDRRRRFVERCVAILPPVDDLLSGSLERDDFALAWAADPRAPVSVLERGATCGALWGDAIPGPGPGTLDAAALAGRWCPGATDDSTPCDGFFAAVFHHSEEGLCAEADHLGLFPIYWTVIGDVCLVGSSPEGFRHHPSFRLRIDPEGLAGILLTKGIVGGRALLAGVRRLPPGRRFCWQPGGAAREVTTYRPPSASVRLADLPGSALADRFAEELTRALDRQAPAGSDYNLLLSGGRDSRLLAGALARRGDRPAAVILGRRRDVEARCARNVARALGFSCRLEDPCRGDPLAGIDLAARWEHLSAGFPGTGEWGLVGIQRAGHRRTISGLLGGGPVSGGIIPARGFSHAAGEFTFERDFARLNLWGIAPDPLRRLFAPSGWRGAVDGALDRLRGEYESIEGPSFARARVFFQAHSERFHIGGVLWRHAFGAWPVAPYGDRRLFALALSFPCAALDRRWLHDEALARSFPDLAALPLDRNSFDPLPIRPRFRHLAAHHLRGRLRALTGRSTPTPAWERRRLYYHRLFSFEAPAWRAIRRHLEPLRGSLDDLFDRATLDRLLPPPERAIDTGDPIYSAGGAKLLLGLLLWVRDHL